MTQGEKELLLKDLCARLPYGVKIEVIENNDFSSIEELDCYYLNRVGNNFYSIKPYLFPLSSMTEKQYKEFIRISGWDIDIEVVRQGKFSCIGYVGLDYLYDAVDWLNANHFDYRGLIPKGLANDATNLNIYLIKK